MTNQGPNLDSELVKFILTDKNRIEILKAVRSVNKEDLWVAGGFVRNLIWDKKHNYKITTELGDIDVFYFNKKNISKDADIYLENQLKLLIPNVTWSVKNQARMNVHNDDLPYHDLSDALMKFPETASAVAVKLNHDNSISILAPLGLNDLFDLKIKPTNFCKENPKTFRNFNKRHIEKRWKDKWPSLKIYHD